MKHALVTTTINVPRNLEAYAADFAKHYSGEAEIIIAGDARSPHNEIQDLANSIYAKHVVPVTYLGPIEQKAFLSKWPLYESFLPWNCIQRRNVAILLAYHAGAEHIYTIDDDNFWEGDDYISQHHSEHMEVIKTSDGWLNPCSDISVKEEVWYPRGFSFRSRGDKRTEITSRKNCDSSVVNFGLWLGDPDIDAVTRLALNPKTTDTFFGESHALAPGVKCPFNSQNTRLDRKVIPAYCMLTGVGRYDDIIPSYFVKRIADHLGDHVSFGHPVVRQQRNAHNVFKDMEDEVLGMQLIDIIVDWLYEIPLTGAGYKSCLEELLPQFREKYIPGGPIAVRKFTDDQILFFESIVENYKQWLRCFA